MLFSGVSALAVAGGLYLGRAAPERPAVAASTVGESVVVSRLVIRFAAEADSGRLATRAEAETALRAIGRSMGEVFAYIHPTAGLSHVVRWTAPTKGRDLDGVLRALRADPRVAQVEVDGVAHRALNPNDELFADGREILWNLKAPSGVRAGGMNLPTAWNRTRSAVPQIAVTPSATRKVSVATRVAVVLPAKVSATPTPYRMVPAAAVWLRNTGWLKRPLPAVAEPASTDTNESFVVS